ncbi:hypothetical protein ACFL27_14050 [candidate division CSSED10-310 bacterium]|uniref:TerB family tellurite resistance protein n=1 Tax=candidate division CSSED10-310 bacterium TaxID=2855610 RepID=A0ABV6YYP2_UNCC1
MSTEFRAIQVQEEADLLAHLKEILYVSALHDLLSRYDDSQSSWSLQSSIKENLLPITTHFARKPLPDDTLRQKMAELIDMMKQKPVTDRDRAESEFLGAAGYLLMTADKHVDEREMNYLANILSLYYFHPRDFLKYMVDHDEINVVLQESSQFITENFPESCRGLMYQLFPIILRDGKLQDAEVRTFMDIGHRSLKIPIPELIDTLVSSLRTHYNPML